MLDIKYIKNNKDLVKKAVCDKQLSVNIDRLLTLYAAKITYQRKIEELKHQINQCTKGVKNTVNKKKISEFIERAKIRKEKISKIEPAYKEIEKEYHTLLYAVPNIPTADTPIGKDESANKVLRKVGTPKKFSFQPKAHWELGSSLDIIDNERAAKVSGARFTYLKRELVILQFGLIQYALSVLTNEKVLKKIIKKNNLKELHTKPFIPIIPPALMRVSVFEKTGRMEPRDDKYFTQEDNLYLIGSAEHTLGPIHLNETIDEEKLPIRYVGYSTSFRREAGTYGKDMKGILRMHQFDKLEMESFTLPEHSLAEQNFFVSIQEYLMQQLKLPYQVVSISTGDMGIPDARQLDIETWLPAQNKYRETHTADLVTDYQSRRLNTKVKRKSGENIFVHMNDATVFAIGRTMIAIIENYQEKNGSIKIPRVLHPYTLGHTTIEARS